MRRLLAGLVGVVLLGCDGAIVGSRGPMSIVEGPNGGTGAGEGGQAGGPNGGTGAGGEGQGGGDEPTVDECASTRDPGTAPVRRLTRREYVSTVRDLLKLPATNVGTTFTPDTITRGFDNNATTQTVSEKQAEEFMGGAEALADAVNLRTLVPCSGTGANETCARQFIADFGKRAYRRPLEQAEIDRLYAVHQKGVTQGPGFDTGLKYVIQVVLQSPQFLYRLELDPPAAGTQKLTGYAVASRLSYFFWGTMPDDALFAAAASGELDTIDGVRAQAQRLVEGAKTREMVAAFHSQWLELDGLDTVTKGTAYTNWATLKPAFKQETQKFVENVFWQDRDLRKLLSADYTFVNELTAGHYGVAAPTAAQGFVKTALGTDRRGLLMQGAILSKTAHSASTSPTQRGKFIRQVLFCHDLPPPPAGVEAEVPEVGPNATTRERYAAHQTNASCAACHKLMDPMGLGLENFDAVGKWRTTENGTTIDVSGEVYGNADIAGPFIGGVALANQLAGKDSINRCMVTQWFRFANGRLESPRDACTIKRITATYGQNGDPIALLLALAESDTFLYRGELERTSP